MFTKEQYLQWKATRGNDPAEWNRDDCIAADAHIRSETFINAREWTKTNVPQPAQDYINLMVRCHYGSGETDEFLQTIKAYPEWI